MGVSEEQVKKMFRSYLSGQISGTDTALLNSTIATGSANHILEDIFREEWENNNQGTIDAINDERKEKLYKLISGHIEPMGEPVKRLYRSKIIIWAVAASVLFAAVLSIYWITGNEKPNAAFASHIPTDYQKYSNISQVQQKLLLDDGSQVWLSPDATLYYPEIFNDKERLVLLQGAAFFDVIPNLEKPFVVESPELRTSVLGTSFWVKEQKGVLPSTVEVRTGKVMVSAMPTSANKSFQALLPVTLLPNHQVMFHNASGKFEVTLSDSLLPIAAANATTLAGGLEKAGNAVAELEYRQPTLLSQVVDDLRNLYGVDIRIMNPAMNNCLLTGDLSMQELHKKLEVICLTIGASFTIEGTAILLKGEGCLQ